MENLWSRVAPPLFTGSSNLCRTAAQEADKHGCRNAQFRWKLLEAERRGSSFQFK